MGLPASSSTILSPFNTSHRSHPRRRQRGLRLGYDAAGWAQWATCRYCCWLSLSFQPLRSSSSSITAFPRACRRTTPFSYNSCRCSSMPSSTPQTPITTCKSPSGGTSPVREPPRDSSYRPRLIRTGPPTRPMGEARFKTSPIRPRRRCCSRPSPTK